MVSVDFKTNKTLVRFVSNPTLDDKVTTAPIDGAVSAIVDSGEATAEPGNGPLEAVVRPVPGFVGTITGRIVADADMGAGVVEIAEVFEIICSSPLAANLGVTAVVE